jgi:hypothetical protein
MLAAGGIQSLAAAYKTPLMTTPAPLTNMFL